MPAPPCHSDTAHRIELFFFISLFPGMLHGHLRHVHIMKNCTQNTYSSTHTKLL